MGALIAFEVARAIRRKGRPGPTRLFVSAAKAPHLKRTGPPRSTLPDAEFRAMLCDMGGTPAAVLQEQELLAMFLPGLRGDFAEYDGDAYRPEPPLDCPVSVYGGLHDREVDHGHLEAWSDHTTRRITIRMFAGGHFFVRTAARQVAQAVLEDFQAREEHTTEDSPFLRLRRVAAWPTAARARP